MRIHRSWFLVAGVIAGLIGGGQSGTAAQSSKRMSHSHPAQSSGRTVALSRAADGQFFSGHGGVTRLFLLSGGKYQIYIWANYDSAYDADNSGTCFFTAYLNGVEKPQFVNLGRGVPVMASSPYNGTEAITFPAGHYKLIVSPFSTCDWSMTILSSGPASPGVDILKAQSYVHSSGGYTATNVAHMGQTFDFSVFYHLVGGLKGKPAGTITFQEHTGPPQSYALLIGPDFYGMKQLYVNVHFSQKEHDVPGPTTAKFTITMGKYHVSQSLKFTLVP